MVALSLDYDYEKAAGLVARGNELESAAAKTKIPFEDLKEYTSEYAEVWNRIIKNERQQLLGPLPKKRPHWQRKIFRNRMSNQPRHRRLSRRSRRRRAMCRQLSKRKL